MASRLQNVYRHVLKKYPTTTQAVQVTLLMGTSDIIAQCAVEKKSIREINWVRTGQFGAMGFFFVGPALKVWYGKLDTIVNPKQTAWKRTIKKVSMDQLAFAPIFTATFTTILSLIQGLKPDEIVDRMKKDFLTIMKMNYTIWPAAQLINFGLVPLNFQVVFAQTVAIIWNTFLSMTLGDSKR